ncbi:MAG TPA: YtxH domain-containing protein [Vicinamibacterales bacterium]|nr:YtxH domain-containing protein [Vicinamibacterales bacterium]
MTDQTRLCAGASVGALVGALVAYLFFTEGGRRMRDRMEPAVDDLMREFHKFRRTLEKVGDMANDGLRAFNEFQAARGQSPFPPGPRTSH